MKEVKVVQNAVEAREAIGQLITQGFSKDEVFVLAHDKDFSENLTRATNTEKISVEEQGVFDSVANVFRSRGDELRSKIQSLGVSDVGAQQLEEELDRGRIVVVAAKSVS
ncbi:general stress protein [Bacillus sp. SA1-12]|uniref:general stress protein n=1 Tax=Bacillus sp. SA1-12 TaxID=1455638 RepID=UPI000626C75D|nr:general stress protein [Bacillus sp. SA1-12]KKI93490.1 general stress protein [Bacillus sp. SA1-12]